MGSKTIAPPMENEDHACMAHWLDKLPMQGLAQSILVCFVGSLLLFTLAACGPGSPVTLDTVGTPTTDTTVPDQEAKFPAAIRTRAVPEPVSSLGPTLPPATVEAFITAYAATSIAQATAAAKGAAQATERSVVYATHYAEQTMTSIVLPRVLATLYAGETQVVQSTRTAFTAQTGPQATVVPPSEWGGVGIEVRVLTDSVQIQFPCDHGTALVPLTLDASGAFNLPGAYTWCPVSCSPNIPAHFRGQVTGSQLSVMVLWGDDTQLNTRGPLTATLGQKADLQGICPICLAGNTLIDSPNGPVPVKDLREGMLVWTESGDTNAIGARQVATVLKTSRTKVPAGHEMVHLVLADGRELWASPGHPTADGRAMGTLSTGDSVNGTRVVSTERVPYDEEYTYDILPSGGTGTYWANGIMIGSTLAESASGP